MHDAAGDFRRAVHAALGNAPELIEFGQIHRFSTSIRPRDKAGWCRLFLDGDAGVFDDFRTGLSNWWQAKFMRPSTLAERQHRAAESQLARTEAEAAQSTQWLTVKLDRLQR